MDFTKTSVSSEAAGLETKLPVVGAGTEQPRQGKKKRITGQEERLEVGSTPRLSGGPAVGPPLSGPNLGGHGHEPTVGSLVTVARGF